MSNRGEGGVDAVAFHLVHRLKQAALVEDRGWTAVVADVAEPGSRWNRWQHPVIPLDVPGVPRGYFVMATKALGGAGRSIR